MNLLGPLTLVLLVLALLGLATSKRAKMNIARTLKFGNCDDSYVKNPKMSYFQNIAIKNVGKGLNVFNGEFVHTRDVESIYNIYQISRCETVSESDCQPMGEYKYENYCDMIVKTNEYWTPLWGAFHPHVECPLHKNVYQIINGTIDAEKLLALGKMIPNFKNSYWRTMSKMHSGKTRKNFACMMLFIQFTEVRI